MPRPLIKHNRDEVRERLQCRERWPVALLAEELGCSREAVYRRIRRDEWPAEEGAIPTETVLECLEEA